jgi:hypothetical protein
MRSLSDFRIFYNQSIAPELFNLERRRKRLMLLFTMSGVLLLGILFLQIYIGIFVVTLLLLLFTGSWIAYLVFRTQVWFSEYKPRIVGLVLDFIDDGINYGAMRYKAKGKIDKAKFLSSRIFTVADEYYAEDYISGKIREMPFELCELRVREFSPSRTKMDYVFDGIFLIGDFHRIELQGSLLLLPDAYRKYLSRSERAFHRLGGRRVRQNLQPAFETYFDTYATPAIRLRDVLSTELQTAILEFRQSYLDKNQEKDIYLSIIGDNLFVALSQRRNLLEPNLLKQAVSFEHVHEFYDDLQMVFQLVEMLDVMN